MTQRAVHQVELRLRGTLDDLDDVHQAISQLAVAASLPDLMTTPLRLALDELITNVVEHGFTSVSDPYLMLRLTCDAHTVTATLDDNGAPFDPTASRPVDTAIDVNERPIGGLGIHLVRQSVDEMHYRRHGDHNCLTIRKRLPVHRDS